MPSKRDIKKVMASANGKSCIRCGAPDAYGCHYNGPRQHTYGKGRGIKCHVLATAESCHRCDQVFAEGTFFAHASGEDWADINDRSEWLLHWIMMTNIRRLEDGLLVVK